MTMPNREVFIASHRNQCLYAKQAIKIFSKGLEDDSLITKILNNKQFDTLINDLFLVEEKMDRIYSILCETES